MSGQIFISYRREDSAASAGRVYDRLIGRFPSNRIFIDVDNIAPGVDFVNAIEKSVESCDVLISVVGKRWLTATDEDGRRRLDNTDDFVRLEIATALKRGIRVIPVLVDGASMPRSGELPDELKSLVRLQALKVSQDRFRSDSEPLITAVDQALKEARAERLKRGLTSTGKKMWLSAAGVVTVLALVVVAAILYFGSQRPEAKPTTPKVAVQPSSQPTSPVAVVTPSPEITASPAALDRRALVTQGSALIATTAKEEMARKALDNATKDHPWVNSLGMKFVPVAATQVLFSVWDTRVQDFEMFVKSTGYDATGGMYSLGKDGWKQRGATWKEPGFSQGANHPVVGVSWNDAEEFCKWLTKRERSAGDLPQDREYRLPKDEEWSAAVGLKDEPGSTPEEKDGKIKLYPWDIPQKRDKSWPPPSGAGNYAGEEAMIGDWPSGWSVIAGYNDGYPRTSLVGSFEANLSGLYDMGGNVWQWCEDWYNAQAQYRVLRGASWGDFNPDYLLASCRFSSAPVSRGVFFGFRCVVAVESSR
jgi:formylglycine-generating enzyme required for sulfatase activity